MRGDGQHWPAIYRPEQLCLCQAAANQLLRVSEAAANKAALSDQSVMLCAPGAVAHAQQALQVKTHAAHCNQAATKGDILLWLCNRPLP